MSQCYLSVQNCVVIIVIIKKLTYRTLGEVQKDKTSNLVVNLIVL